MFTLSASIFSGCEDKKQRGSLEGEDVDFGDPGQACVFDEDNVYADGERLELGKLTQGFICPLGDSD